MDLSMKKPDALWIWKVVFIHFLVAFAGLAVYIVEGLGILSLSHDFNTQELAFYAFAGDAIKKGNIFYNWSIDIGSDFVPSFSFYLLGSPFFWISLLFPSRLFPYVLPWLYIAKYITTGVFSFLYIRRYIKPKYALISSLLYSFSGFQCTNLVFFPFP